MARNRNMALIAFLQAQNCSNYVGSWRDPAAPTDFLTADYYSRIARTLEDAGFDMAFFDDRLAMPDIYGSSHELAARHGIRPVKLDPTVVLMTMAAATKHLGLGATYSTTYHQPYHVARVFATLDLMSGGRVAWNVVTSMNSSEAANFGHRTHLDHDIRYDRADEFLSVVTKLWDTWEADAIQLDKAAGVFADPAKLKRTEHTGEYFDVNGTFTVPRSPQGQPVILQAGSSGRGMAFAGKWAEVIFTSYPSLQAGVRQYEAHRDSAAKAGRDPDGITIAPAVTVITGATQAIVDAKKELLSGLARPEDGLALLCEVLDADFANRDIDEPFNDEELAAMSWQGLRERVTRESGKNNPSVADFVKHSGRGTLNPGSTFVGTPNDVTDQLEEWFNSCCDGFVLSAASVPASYEDFARLITPQLRARGLVREEYAGTTLRSNLGIDVATAVSAR